jgi:DNA invertase Pin-like site-specific DNA recombinase
MESTHKERIGEIQLKSEGHSYREIQRQTGIDKTAVHRIFNEWNTENPVINKPHSGRQKYYQTETSDIYIS